MAILINQTSTVGTIEDDSIIGTAGNDTLGGGLGDDTLFGEAGDDTLDGGAGFNTVEYAGSEYDYIITRQQDGSVTVRAITGTPYEADGTDTLRNVQLIRFLDGNTERILDDVSNLQDASNVTLSFGQETKGQTFVGDKDWYQVTGGNANQAVHISLAGGTASYLTATGLNIYDGNTYPDRLGQTTLDANGHLGIQVANNSLGINAVGAYRFTVLRDLLGTDTAETLSAGTTAEYLDAKGGNDSVVGSERSDYLAGGLGSDTLVGGLGNDNLVGGDEKNDHDVAVYSGRFADYTITPSGWSSQNPAQDIWWTVNGPDGTDYVKGVEILRFADQDYVIDDYDVFQGADIAGQPSYAQMGQVINGRFNSSYDDDWIAFDFGRGVVDKTTTLKVTVAYKDSVYNPNFSIVNATGFALQFTDLADNSQKSNLNGSSWTSGTHEYLIKGTQWGANAEGGAFGGNQAFLVISGSYVGNTSYFYTNPELGAYSITLSRYRAGTTGDDVLTTDGATEQQKADEVAGLGGNDQITGTDRAEVFDGGDGNDTIHAGGGADRIKGGAGTDALFGEAGDDVFVISGESTVTDSFDGGDGTDTLKLESGDVNLTGATFTSIEKIEGNGQRVTVSSAQLAGFASASGVIFGGSNQDLQALAGNYILEGSKGDDVLKAGAGDNTIRAYAGNNTVVAGDGNDTVLWQSGYGANWEQQYRANQVLSSETSGNAFVIKGNFDGGTGTDALEFVLNQDLYFEMNFGGLWWSGWTANQPGRTYAIDLTQANITGFETLKLTTGTFVSNGVTASYGPEFIYITATQYAGLSTLSGGSFVIKGGGTVDLSTKALLNGATVSFAGDVAYNITGTASGETIATLGGNDTINAGAGNDTISAGAGVDSIDAGIGNDVILISGKSAITDTLTGGDGTDILRITGADVDLSGATLSGIEKLEANSSSLALTQAQYDQFAGNLTGSAGLILKMTEAGTADVASLPVGFVGIRGTTDNDTLVGGSNADLLVGDAGDDSLSGGAGNDRLVAGAGNDTLRGGDGDDSFSFDGISAPTGIIDGGAGTDKLVVTNGLDLTHVTLVGVEQLTGSGTVTLTNAQLASLSQITGANIQLGGSGSTLSLGAVELSPNISVRLPSFDINLSGQTGVLGTAQDDVIIGGSGDDRLIGGRGVDVIDGGAGNDTLIGGSGADTLIGGSGDDRFEVAASEFTSSNQTVYSDHMDGGTGSNTLAVTFNSSFYSNRYVFSQGAVANLETIVIGGGRDWNTIELQASQWRALTTLAANGSSEFGANKYYYPGLQINGDGGDISLTAISADSHLRSLALNGQFGQIDASKYTFGPDATNGDVNSLSINVQNFDSIKLSAGSDALRVQGDIGFTVDAGAGDDWIRVTGVNKVTGTITGGAGTDTLDISQSGFIDLTGLTLDGVESIYQESTTVLVTEAQLANWSFDGSGAKYTKVSSIIVGTAGNDSYNGDGTGSFQGGKGDDSISNVNTAVFTGNYAEYDFTPPSGNTRTVQQARGSMTDGTDTVTGVMNLQFADTTLKIDDAPDDTWSYVNNVNWSSLIHADYGKAMSGKKDFTSDSDVFSATLAPNSPLAIEGSSFNGNGWRMTFMDATTGQQIVFKSLVYGQLNYDYYNWMDASQKWLPGFNTSEGFQAYQGGAVVFQVNIDGGIQDYAFTLNYLDDYAGSVDTLGQMNAQTGVIKGYVGDIGDADWIRTDLIAGTKYEFHLNGVSSGGGTLVDPMLQLLDSAGRLLESGIDLSVNAVGNDDALIFRPTESGSYYLAVTDVGSINKGSWTLTQQSLDTIAGNTTTTERIEWSGAQTFTVNSEVNVLSDHDWFKVWLDKGMTYDFRALGVSQGGTLADPQLSLRSASGILLAQDDNGGGSTDAKLFYSAPDSGWYYLDAGASGNASKGTYILKGASLADDFSNDVFTTGMVQTNGTPLHGLASYIGDSDWVKVGLSKGVTYVIDLAGDVSDSAQLDPLTDPLLTVRDANGNFIARFDDFGGTLNSRAYFTPTADGLYYLEAKSAFKHDIGAYQITVTQAPADDFDAAFNSNAATLTLGTAQVGDIGIPGDHDVFQMNLEAGKVYQLGVGGLSGHAGTLTDPYLRVFDSAGHLLDFDNNGGVGSDAQMYFAPTSTGTYYVEASSNNDRAMGSYSVTVAQRDMPADDVPNNLSTQVFLTPGDSFAGNLLTHNDQDWFGVKLIGGKGYTFRAQASHSGNGSLADPVLEIRAADGTLVKSVDNMLISNEPATSFTPVADGTYYLVVKAADGQTDTGTYTLVTRAPDDYSNTKSGATTIALDQTLDGAIQWSDGAFGVRAYDSVGLATDVDEDWFKFTATAGQVLSVNVQIAQGSALSRPMVEVVDSLGRSMAVGDGLETNNGLAVATFRAPDAGTYFARVIDGAGATGAYKIALTAGDASDEDASGPVALDFVNQGAIVQAQANAKIGLTGDTDAFTVSLQAGHSYRIETLAVRDGTHAPLPSAQLDLNWLAQGAATPEHISVAGEVASPSFFDSTLFEATNSGTMSINVAPLEATQTGQYKLRVVDLGTSQADDRPDAAANYVEATYGVLAVNENTQGRIDTASDVDLFAINLTAGNVYDFSVKSYADGLGTLAQGSLRLLDATGQLVTAGAFDNVAGRTSLPVSVFEDGRYYLSVSAVDLPGNTGTYTLDTRLRGAAQASDDISADTRSGINAGPGLPATGVINYAGDHDWIRASLEAGKVYVLDVLADGDGAGGTLKDATLRLLDAQGNELAFDDNSGAALDAHLQYTPSSGGEYYLDVGSNGAETGTYTMRVRELYSGVADPLQSAQWYLSAAGIDALKGQITGAGVTVGVVDDGIDTSHPDLQNQLNFALAYDTQFDTQDGAPKYPVLVGPPDNHGTLVAGIVAAQANNETGIVGVAPDADLVSTRVKWSWDQITEALGLQWQFDVSNNSWGAINPFGDNFNSTNLTFAWQALRTGVEDGRDGLGTVFVFSAGNSAANGDNTNYHNFQNAREVIAVGAADADGSMAGFSTPGANVLVSSYGVNMITTDRHQPGWGENGSSNYVTNFTGTSAAAPMISGITALMLEANPNLGYRDVQEILVYASTHPDNQDWKTNAASNFNLGGLQFNDKAGFGLVDAYSAVRLAQTWTEVSTAINEVSASARAFGLTDAIPDGTGAVYSRSFTIDSTMSVEHVELGVDVRHTRLGDLVIELTSPNGTVSTLMNRPTVNAEQPFGLSGTDSGVPTHLLWDFSSVQFWGEEASGTWTVTVKDVRAEETGSLSSLSLRVYGARDDGNDTYVFTEEGFQGQTTRVLSDESGIDTINASPMLHDMYVNLGAAALIASQGVTYKIADWSVIENAITGSGNDRLDGNDAVNRLNGMEGNDTLTGGLGNDVLMGGAGSDVAYYAGAMAEFSKSWNPNTKTVTVVDNVTSNGDEGTDSLIGIERIVFSDGEISLSADVGNQAPVATALVFDSPVFMAKGMGIDYALPDNAFSDPDGTAVANLEISVADASGGELPDWLSYDPVTGKFSGVPPQDYQGQLKLLVTAVDEFGVSVSDILTLQFGDNQAPVLQSPSELLLAEDAGLVALNIAVPFDPEGKTVTIKLLDIPSQGAVLDKSGNQLAVGALMSADELSELHYQTLADGNGNAGYVRFQATDEDGVVSESSVHIFINPVNDAPRFATSSSTLVIQYPAQSTVTLDMQQPSDPESVLTTVRLIELPALGSVTLDGQAVQLEQVLTFDQLQRLNFTLTKNVNGPIGAVTVQAVDPQGAATNWSLALEVQGDVAYSTGTAGADALYGSIGNDTLYGMAGNDILVGNAGADRLLGGLGNDSLFGGSGNDALDGSSGNDYLDGGTGADVMSGGPGADTYFVDSSGDIVLEVISGGAGGKDLIITSVSLTAPTNVEGLQAAVGAAVASLTGNGLDNTLLGNEADNLLSGYAGRDTLLGAQGNDTLDGGSGVDRMAGGTGNDVYFVDSRSDAVIELASEGLDTVNASASFTLGSNIENLMLQGVGDFTAGGNSLDNRLVGNAGNNILAGGLGRDTLEGGLGDDVYVVNDGLDTLIDTGGNDTIRTTLDVTLQADFENAELVGIGDPNATGNAANNRLVGNMGDNILDGLLGTDTLTGGLGSDQFMVGFNGSGVAVDQVTDFLPGTDLLVVDLAALGIDVALLGLVSSGTVSDTSFVKGAGVQALDPGDQFLFDTARAVLSFDADGSGWQAPIDLVQLFGVSANNLTCNDIYIAV